MIVGIDVHKHTHAAALIDDRGGEIATLIIANDPGGYRRLVDWLVDHQAADAVIGVESPGSYAAAWSPPCWARGLRSCTCRRGGPIASVTVAGRARPIPATRSRSPTSS